MSDLPAPVTRDQQLLRAVCDRLDAQNELLGQIRDRLPEAAPVGGPGEVVELREPAAPPAPEQGPDTVGQKPAPARRARKSPGRAGTASKETS